MSPDFAAKSRNVAASLRTLPSFLPILLHLSEDFRETWNIRLIFRQLTADWLGVAAFSIPEKPGSGNSTATSAHPKWARRGLRQIPWLYGRVLCDHNEIIQACGNVAGADATPSGGETLPADSGECHERQAIGRGRSGEFGTTRGVPCRAGGVPRAAGGPSPGAARSARGGAREGAAAPGGLPDGGGSGPGAGEPRRRSPALSSRGGGSAGLGPLDGEPAPATDRGQPAGRRALQRHRRGGAGQLAFRRSPEEGHRPANRRGRPAPPGGRTVPPRRTRREGLPRGALRERPAAEYPMS